MVKSLLRTDSEIAEIYQRHVKTVYRVCYTYMKNTADTEDATSETFVRMIKTSPVFKSGEHEKAWLIRTAINVCKDYLKRSCRKDEGLENHSETLSCESVFETDGVITAVLELPDKYKSVVYMYYYEGYTSVQISAMLKKPQSTIRNYLSEARNILRERLGDSYE
ncbi:MAG: RNA polymerase sigma factor [Oscillospiraceae bacterium]|nr:RNA polymerase sigma factor [Oscillospiraceae bacterium]